MITMTSIQHFYFIGKDDDGKELVYDAVMYTCECNTKASCLKLPNTNGKDFPITQEDIRGG